jgi:hypothetical protein
LRRGVRLVNLKAMSGWLGLLIAVMGSGEAAAHGGVAMDQDVCKLTIGPYLMHFTGYQPDVSRSEFCEDIPKIGRTVIVLDFIDDLVRDIPLEFTIVRQKDGAIEPGEVVFHVPPKRYPTGSVAIEYAFTEPGSYAGIVALKDQASHRSVFPFAVGQNRLWLKFAGFAAILILGAVGLFFWANRRRSLQTELARQERGA